MSRAFRRPARDRVRVRPLYDLLEGRYAAGSLLGLSAIGGVALWSVRSGEEVGGPQPTVPSRFQDRGLAVPPAQRLEGRAATARSQSNAPVLSGSARTVPSR